jgi:hypothetical protein
MTEERPGVLRQLSRAETDAVIAAGNVTAYPRDDIFGFAYDSPEDAQRYADANIAGGHQVYGPTEWEGLPVTLVIVTAAHLRLTHPRKEPR